MSRKSSAVALTATITVTIFVAAMTFVFNPDKGGKDYASVVLEEAKKRQNTPVTVVPQHLETDIEVLREEDIMAGKVSEILLSDDGFVSSMGDVSAKYVGEKISDLEDIYASDTIERIESGDKESMSYADALYASSKSYSDSSDSAIKEEVESLKAEISTLKGSLDSVKESQMTREEVLSSILEDKVFMDKLSEEVSKRVGGTISTEDLTSAILASEAYKTGLLDAMNEYHEYLEKAASSIPIPVFETHDSQEYTEEEYLEKRNENRGEEIDKILSFLGY